MSRFDARALEPLSRFVDFQRRLDLAAAEVRVRLAALPAERWRVEPYPLTGGRGSAFVVLGETGFFVISATFTAGHWDDVIAASMLAAEIQALVPGWGGRVQPAICHPFTGAEPRLWYRPDDRGAWVSAWLVGGDSVIAWLEHFGPAHGLGVVDLARFDELTTSNWLQAAIPAAPPWPPIGDAGPPGCHG
jgi:hypothetical protein